MKQKHLQGQGGARAALGVLGELNAYGLAVGQARVLERVDVVQVVGLGREHDLARPVTSCMYGTASNTQTTTRFRKGGEGGGGGGGFSSILGELPKPRSRFLVAGSEPVRNVRTDDLAGRCCCRRVHFILYMCVTQTRLKRSRDKNKGSHLRHTGEAGGGGQPCSAQLLLVL